MNKNRMLFNEITQDQRYFNNLDWGKPRRGHPEGTVRSHIEELERNLDVMAGSMSSDQFWRLRILIHVHDSFKAEAARGVGITDPNSHASLARSFLASHCNDQELLNQVQFHDESYAIWRGSRFGRPFNEKRVNQLIHTINDWELFIRFLAIDGVTAGKSIEPLYWMSRNIANRIGREDLAISLIDLLSCALKQARHSTPVR